MFAASHHSRVLIVTIPKIRKNKGFGLVGHLVFRRGAATPPKTPRHDYGEGLREGWGWLS